MSDQVAGNVFWERALFAGSVFWERGTFAGCNIWKSGHFCRKFNLGEGTSLPEVLSKNGDSFSRSVPGDRTWCLQVWEVWEKLGILKVDQEVCKKSEISKVGHEVCKMSINCVNISKKFAWYPKSEYLRIQNQPSIQVNQPTDPNKTPQGNESPPLPEIGRVDRFVARVPQYPRESPSLQCMPN